MTPPIILSARRGKNRDLFADIAALYIPDGARVLDMTYGQGNFWRDDVRARVKLTTNDLETEADFHVDLRYTNFPDGAFDVCVLDPPYAHHPGNPSKALKERKGAYGLSKQQTDKETLQLYFDGIKEAARILKRKGLLIVKCQDTTRQWNHIEIAQASDFKLIDLFILMQESTPIYRSDLTQHMARKNHSYYLILQKVK